MSPQIWPVVGNALTLFGLMILAPIFGYGCGLRVRARRPDHKDHAQLGTIQGAVLGLLALILGFSFASAAGRFIDRQDFIVQEANAIGTAYLRADLLEEPFRSNYRELLRQYTASRIKLLQTLDIKAVDFVIRESTDLHPKMWQVAVDGVKKTTHYDVTVLSPLNEVIDLHTSHLAIMRRHIPPLVVILLIVNAIIALMLVGYGNGLAGKPSTVLTTGLTFLIFSVLWITVDLDYPRLGILRIGHQPMIELQQSLK
ncbi:MAG: hypothetical protein U0903_05395 [Planctomycetales bacterium]